jgi:translation initiation factor 2-alpha kinase 4
MLLPTKKTHASCLGLLADLSEMSLQNGTTQQGRTRAQSIAMSGPKTPRASFPNNYVSSPEIEYFAAPQRARHASRWKEDWEELEMLVSLFQFFALLVLTGNLDIREKEHSDQLSKLATKLIPVPTQVRSPYCAFVASSALKLGTLIIIVKKIKLRTTQSDNKIFREVNALSRLSHRFIVRYYTTWVETSEPVSAAVSSGSASETDITADDTAEGGGMTSVPHSSHSNPTEDTHSSGFNGRFSVDLNDLDDMGLSGTQSFPSIHFGGSGGSQEKISDEEDDSDNSDDPFGNLFSKEDSSDPVEVTKHRPKTPPVIARTLYIQMVRVASLSSDTFFSQRKRNLSSARH